MKKITTIVSLMVLFVVSGYSQSTIGDTLHIQKNRFFYQNQPLKSRAQLNEILQTNQDAYSHYKKAKSKMIIALPLSYAGGFCLGYGLTSAMLSGESSSLVIAGVGVGLLAVAFPLAFSADKHTKQAMKIFNNSKRGTPTSYRTNDVNLLFGVAPNGMKLKIVF